MTKWLVAALAASCFSLYGCRAPEAETQAETPDVSSPPAEEVEAIEEMAVGAEVPTEIPSEATASEVPTEIPSEATEEEEQE